MIEPESLAALERLSRFLNDTPCAITGPEVKSVAACGVPEETAYALLLAACSGVDAEGARFRRYFAPIVRRLDARDYRGDPYCRALRFPSVARGAFRLGFERYRAYEAFVRDDLERTPDGRVLPRIGYFNEEFRYPAALENGRIWMTVTPNEIATMRQPIARAHGRVATYGLGLGYFAFHAARRLEVASVTVVEQSSDVIALFRDHLLPQMRCADKIHIVQGDAFDFAAREATSERFDYVFADLWHDALDGTGLYLRLKALERPGVEYQYWIEQTLRFYL